MKKPQQKQKTSAKPVPKQAPLKRKGSSGALPWLIIAGILVVTFLAFMPMLSNEFTKWDDADYVTENLNIQHMDAAKVQHIFTHPIAYNYHPLTMLSLGINYSFARLNPQPYYLTNLLLHLANIVLVFWFIFLLSNKNLHVASFAALVFAIHPMHVESVAWISERKDVLYTFFFISALISYLFYLLKRKIGYYVLTLLLAVCSMASKPAAIIFPLVLLLIDYYRSQKINVRSLLMKLPYFLAAAFFLYMTWIAQTHDTMLEKELRTDNHFQNFLFAWYGFLVYIIKFFVPFHLAAFHPYPEPPGLLVYLAPVGVIAISVAIYFLKTQRRLLLFGMGFFLINLILVLQFISVGSAMYAERYTYVSYLGLLFILGMMVFEKTSVDIKRYAWIIIGLLSLSFTYFAHERVKVWHNAETLWADEIEKYPTSYKGYLNRGSYYTEEGESAKAIADFTKAIKYEAGYKAYSNRAVELMKMGQTEKALADIIISLKLNNTQVEAYITRAQIYNTEGRFDEALVDASKSISIKPTYEGFFTRAAIYKAKKMYDESLADYTTASTLSNDVSVFVNRGNVYYTKGDYEKAIADYNKVLQQNPDDVNALSNRGSAYYQLNRIDEALSDYSRAITLRPSESRFYVSRSYMYDKKGNKASALRDAQTAMKSGLSLPPEYMAKISR
jgi:tetratricopeptide (TPR) repeat protein